jgi:hypothetical protein
MEHLPLCADHWARTMILVNPGIRAVWFALNQVTSSGGLALASAMALLVVSAAQRLFMALLAKLSLSIHDVAIDSHPAKGTIAAGIDLFSSARRSLSASSASTAAAGQQSKAEPQCLSKVAPEWHEERSRR